MLSGYIIAKGSQLALNFFKVSEANIYGWVFPSCLLCRGDKFPKSGVKSQ